MNQSRFSTVLLLLLLAGCSSQPRQVSANLPLVQPYIQPIGAKVPALYRQDLENPLNQQISHPHYQIKMGPFYTSSLGNECRELTILNAHNEKFIRVACAEAKQYDGQIRAWYLVPNIVQSSSSIQL